ncbi:YigZ family protein [Marispirochaeta aestuarii]|uniref:YigZ family protein n=1 Tax=Marispirochaeta aestuarii TaxID=1963862 RepID=UPI0029C71BE3|nr:YigZ family protein [Marispirochaeta aestuarii]
MFVPTQSRAAELEIKKSLFLATAHPVSSEDEAKEIIRRTREEHPKSTHVVWAFVLGDENTQHLGMSDDGEPRGTAGKPALSTLQYSGLTNILVCVVRYFGGTKLGTGGLVKAYIDSTKAVIDDIPRKLLVEETVLGLRFGYHYYEGVRKVLGEYKARIEAEDFGTDVSLKLSIETEHAGELKQALGELTSGSVVITA